MAIRNGDLADADSLLNNVVGTQFRNFSNILYNSAYIGFNSSLGGDGAPNLKNIKYTISGDFDDDTTENSDHKTGVEPNIYGGFEVMDLFNDGDLYLHANGTDTNDIWTATISGDTGLLATYISEGTGEGAEIYLGGRQVDTVDGPVCSIYSDQASAPDFNDDCTILVDVQTSSAGASTGTTYTKMEITDGSTYVTIMQNVEGSGNLVAGLHRIEIDTTENEAYLYDQNDPYGTPIDTIDISGLNDASVWRLKFTIQAQRNSTAILRLNSIKYIPSTGASSTWSGEFLTGTTITDAIPTFNITTEGSSTATYYLTADGTNYEEVTPDEIHRFTNTGTSLGARVVFTSSDGTELSQLNEYAILYNVGAA